MNNLRKKLSKLKTLQNLSAKFPLGNLPETPQELFLQWLDDAIDEEIAEPHAMLLSTVDQDHMPDARVLILKDLDSKGWHFASSKNSKKGSQIEKYSKAALTFYWQALGRSVRIRGHVLDLGPEIGLMDFKNRSVGAKAVALMGQQSAKLENEGSLQKKFKENRQLVEQNPDIVSDNWRVYTVEPHEVEFWQGDINRCHQRVRYMKIENGNFKQELLWP